MDASKKGLHYAGLIYVVIIWEPDWPLFYQWFTPGEGEDENKSGIGEV